ncbi:hypothetical protein [Streptomyces sp. TR02-1]|uniref:hypothetical protein n=1 Tax=Streptomyces sp. TR02-1 TaxID=3385977 RepID=UPI0039A22DC6
MTGLSDAGLQAADELRLGTLDQSNAQLVLCAMGTAMGVQRPSSLLPSLIPSLSLPASQRATGVLVEAVATPSTVEQW